MFKTDFKYFISLKLILKNDNIYAFFVFTRYFKDKFMIKNLENIDKMNFLSKENLIIKVISEKNLQLKSNAIIFNQNHQFSMSQYSPGEANCDFGQITKE